MKVPRKVKPLREVIGDAAADCPAVSIRGDVYALGDAIANAVIDALADGVTEEMAKLAVDVYEDQPRLIDHRVMRRALSAAIRAAKSREA